jgi:predicted GTPase
MPTICVLGATGVGKGSTLNSCFRSSQYGTSSMFASDTIKPAMHELPWRGTGEPMRGVDLCGFSDSEGRDTGFIESMVAYLKEEVRYVNCFLLLLNSQEARVGMHLKDMLVALKNVFGLPFMKNVLIGFTRWDYTKKGAILRRGVTKEVQCHPVQIGRLPHRPVHNTSGSSALMIPLNIECGFLW